jgi:hypothetical protein
MTTPRPVLAALPIMLAIALAACASPVAAPTSAPPVDATEEPAPEPTAEPTPEPTPTPVANCMDADVYGDLTNPQEVDWNAVSQSERDDLAAELEAYDFSDQREGVQDFVDRAIEALRAGRGPDPGFINSVLTAETPIVPCE